VAEEASLGEAGEAEAKVPVMLFCRGCGRFGAPSRRAEVLRGGTWTDCGRRDGRQGLESRNPAASVPFRFRQRVITSTQQ
jgi:hypothetical protein